MFSEGLSTRNVVHYNICDFALDGSTMFFFFLNNVLIVNFFFFHKRECFDWCTNKEFTNKP